MSIFYSLLERRGDGTLWQKAWIRDSVPKFDRTDIGSIVEALGTPTIETEVDLSQGPFLLTFYSPVKL